jgi:ribosomal large subunit pseudouridine synthase D (EC 5.4.99.-)
MVKEGNLGNNGMEGHKEAAADIRQIRVTEKQQGLRLDRGLAEQLPELSRSRLQQLIRQGQVWLNGQPCRDKDRPLQAGDEVEVRIPPATPTALQPEPIPLDILYEDDDLLVINKPRGLVVHPAPGHASGTLVHALLAHCPHLSGINGELRPGIVHRLDKDTTGALVIAKHDQAHQHLQPRSRPKPPGASTWGWCLAGRPKAKAPSLPPLGGTRWIGRKWPS